MAKIYLTIIWQNRVATNFHWVRQAVVCVVRLASCLWLWFQSVCPLSAPTVLLGFLLPWTWGISSRLLQQTAATASYLGHGVTPFGRCPWPWTWGSSPWLLLSRGPAIYRWHHPYGRKWRRTKEPLDESKRGEWKSWLKAQHSEN